MRKDDGHAPSAAPVASAVQHARLTRAEAERVLGEIFAHVLDIPDVGPTENFFDLGATSLLMVRARNEIKTRLGRELAMNDLFEHTTVADLAGFLVGKEDVAKVAAAQARGARQNDLFGKLRKLAGKAPQ